MYRRYKNYDDFVADSEMLESSTPSRRNRSRLYRRTDPMDEDDEQLLVDAANELSEPIDEVPAEGDFEDNGEDKDTEGDEDIKRQAHDIWADDYDYISELVPCTVGCWGAIVRGDDNKFYISVRTVDTGVELLPDEWNGKTYDDDEAAESDLKKCLGDVIKAKDIKPDIRIDEAVNIIFEKNRDHILNS